MPKLRLAIFLFCLVFISSSCSKSSRLKRMYSSEKRNYFLSVFSRLNILSRGSSIVIYFDTMEMSDGFWFEKRGKTVVPFTDSIQDIIHQKGIPIPSHNDTSFSNTIVSCQQMQELLSIMDSFDIVGVRVDWQANGIDMKIYLDDFSALLYVRDTNAITDEIFKHYIFSGIKIDEGWYYVVDKN